MSKNAERLARLILLLILSAAGAVGIFAYTRPAAADMEIHARMAENGGWSAETLYAQVGKPLRLRLTSDDVLHSFAIGQSGKPPIDLKPGEWAETTLVFDKPGRYTYYCTRWCGRNHWRMRGTIIVDPAGDSTGSLAAAGSGTPGGPDTAAAPAQSQPLYLRLGLDIDAPHRAGALPAAPLSPERGAAAISNGAAAVGAAADAPLPAWALDQQTYLSSSPAALWQRLRADPSQKARSDADLWNIVAYLYTRQLTPAKLAEAQQLYATNCAACHGETGKGDGVMVEGLPRYVPGEKHTSPAAGTAHAGDVTMSPAAGTASAGDVTNSPAAGTALAGDMASGMMAASAPPDLTDPRTTLGASPALFEGKLLRGGMGTGMPNWGPIFTQSQLDALVAYLYTFAMQR